MRQEKGLEVGKTHLSYAIGGGGELNHEGGGRGMRHQGQKKSKSNREKSEL